MAHESDRQTDRQTGRASDRRTDREAELERQRLVRERDLYRRLLDLGGQTELEPFLKEALGLVVEVAGARQGYLELRNPRDDTVRWSIAHGFSDREVEDVRSRISVGIIAEALATGRVIDTPSALADERFASRESVHREGIQAVLCAPIGEAPPLGALYIQGRERPGPFDGDDRERAAVFARHLAPLADNLLLRRVARDAEDPTRALRKRLRLDAVVGRSSALAALLHEVSLVAPLDVSVLLTGESGTGKSLVARVIHDNGPRAAHPFVEINCAAFPEGLIESELFGALPGSHSTATRRIPGKVAAAERGTILLDEVGDLSPAAQSKLLQLLQSRTYYPLGAAEPSHADVRILAATNVDLEEAVARGRFREDLYYRLQVLPLRVPSLEERRPDIGALAERFCEEACARHRLPRVRISTGGLRALETAEWPGNVRQLAHAVEAAAIRAAGEGVARVEQRHLFPDARRAAAEETEPLTFQEATRQFQRELLAQTLVETGWNVSETARRLELSRSHVYNLIEAFQIDRGSAGSS